MVLIWLITIPAVAAVVAWLVSRWNSSFARWVALIALAGDFLLALTLWLQSASQSAQAAGGPWLYEFNQPWIPQLGISFYFAMDGLSLLLVLLTLFLGMIVVAASWNEIQERVGFFHFNLLWILAAIIGVFIALDLFLFYFLWEMMLIPMYLLIALWGHERRVQASIKFFLFTQVSGLFMLLGILGLYFVHGSGTGTFTFNYSQLLGTAVPPLVAFWLMLAFLIGFAVKLPVVPFHTWLPDAHTEAPTAGSVILAGLMLKTGAYGMIRFVVPLFPDAALAFAPVAMALGVMGILYGAALAFSQTDLKRLVAYTSVSHMGFVLLGVFAWNELALQGAVVEILAHGISTGALFVLVGALQERIHTRDVRRMGGLWEPVPRMGAVGLVFALASLGLPGLGNFVAEFLVLLGSFQANPLAAIIAALGLIAATVYALWMIQVAFQGSNKEGWRIPDLGRREMATFAAMIAVIIWLGLVPQPVINTARQSLDNLRQVVETRAAAESQDRSGWAGVTVVSGSETSVVLRDPSVESSGAFLAKQRVLPVSLLLVSLRGGGLCRRSNPQGRPRNVSLGIARHQGWRCPPPELQGGSPRNDKYDGAARNPKGPGVEALAGYAGIPSTEPAQASSPADHLVRAWNIPRGIASRSDMPPAACGEVDDTKLGSGAAHDCD